MPKLGRFLFFFFAVNAARKCLKVILMDDKLQIRNSERREAGCAQVNLGQSMRVSGQLLCRKTEVLRKRKDMENTYIKKKKKEREKNLFLFCQKDAQGTE